MVKIPKEQNGAAAQPCGTPPRASHTASDGNHDETGAIPSNTAPANCTNGSNTGILRTGIDSLYLSYPGDLSAESAIRLEALKKLAQSKDPNSNKLAQHQIGDHLFEVADRGRSVYKYVLRDHWYNLAISAPYTDHTPLAYVQLASEALTFEGAEAVEEDLSSVIASLGCITGGPGVSRVDLCVDFTTDVDVESIQEGDWVTRARTFNRYSVQRIFSGLTIGLGGIISARLYDKTLELEKSHKDYLKAIWGDLGWNGHSRVWRLEFQLKRDFLKQLGIRTFSDLTGNLGALWLYATSEWLRLTCPDPTDSTQSRWPLHPLWESLQAVNWGSSHSCDRQHTPKGRPPSDKSLFVNGLSGLTSYMAREGITDAYVGAPAFFRAAAVYHSGREHYTGLSFEDYVQEKVESKAKRFNSIRNRPPEGELHPADDALAREYRRRSNGE
ncbi:MAG: replication initiation factor [Candidatus Sedimenticola sp. (ex Thyasira tokunagai)]